MQFDLDLAVNSLHVFIHCMTSRSNQRTKHHATVDQVCSLKCLLLGHGGIISVLVLNSPPDGNIVMAIVLRDDTHTWPLVLVVIWVMCHKLLCVGHVQTEGLNGVV